MKDNNDLVAARIKELRVSKRLSQNNLAKSLNLTVTAYNRAENGKTQLTINMLFAVAAALDVSIISLLGSSLGILGNKTNSWVIADFYDDSLHVTISAEVLKKHLMKNSSNTYLR